MTDTLRPFARALHDQLDALAQTETPRPDLADVLARAEVLAPDRVPTGLRASLPTDDLDAEEVEDPGLDVFADALRERHERVLHERRHSPIPVPPSADGQRRWTFVLVGVAAAVLLAVAIGASLSAVVGERDPDRAPMGAERNQITEGTEGAASRHERASKAIVREEDPRVEPPEPPETRDAAGAPEIQDALEIEVAPEAGGAPEPMDSAEIPPREHSSTSLSALEAQARAAWRRGELARAERLFRIIVRREGHGSHADLAYGDLFSLARQRRGAKGQAKIWREYLRQFPRGRFAQDARAGLCRRASEEERARCWQRYLDAHPTGTHASEARAAVSKAKP